MANNDNSWILKYDADLNDDINMEDEFENNDEPEIVVKDVKHQQKHEIDEEQIDDLYQTLDINDDLVRKIGPWRLNVIHIRGVQEMSSDDVLAYFNDYDPNSIEWINDLACNVVFDDEKSAANALINLTNAIIMKNPQQNVDENGTTIIDCEDLQVPVPPGRWRLGLSHPKSKALLLRFANISDKKMKGARKLSNYYAKYGVPLTNKSTNVRKREAVKRSIDDVSSVVNSKRLRLRMRADDEEELIEQRKRITTDRLGIVKDDIEENLQNNQVSDSKKKSIWERLDNDKFGNFCAEDANILQLAVVKEKSSFCSRISIKPNLKSQISKSFIKSRLGIRTNR